MDIDLPQSMEGESNFLSEPGTYHVAVLNVDEHPTTRDGAPVDGFKVQFCVLDGTVAGQQKKEVELTLYNPKASDKNNGEFAKRKQARFAMATGILPEAQPGQRVSVDLQQALGRQLIIEVERKTDQATGQPSKFLQLAWANIWHVDDPAVCNEPDTEHRNWALIPKDANAIGLLPAKLRRSAESFAVAKTGNGQPKPQQQTQPQKPASGAVNLDDL